LLDELDVENTPHYHHRIEQITYRSIHIKQSQETANGRGSRHTISISLTTTRTLIKQPSVQNTPYFTVAKKGGTDDVRGKSVPYCRKQDLASQDGQQTIGNITEAILATDGPKWSFYDHHLTSTLCPLPFENSSQPSEGRPPLSAQSTEYSKRFQYRGSNQPHRTPWEAISRIRARIQNTPHGNKKRKGKNFQGRHGQLREQVLGLSTHGLRHNL